MSYHIYETHPENNRPISILVDDDLVIAKYEDDDDIFFTANQDEEDDVYEMVVNEFGAELADRLFNDE
jgi:hypothetical protein